MIINIQTLLAWFSATDSQIRSPVIFKLNNILCPWGQSDAVNLNLQEITAIEIVNHMCQILCLLVDYINLPLKKTQVFWNWTVKQNFALWNCFWLWHKYQPRPQEEICLNYKFFMNILYILGSNWPHSTHWKHIMYILCLISCTH